MDELDVGWCFGTVLAILFLPDVVAMVQRKRHQYNSQILKAQSFSLHQILEYDRNAGISLRSICLVCLVHVAVMTYNCYVALEDPQ